MVLAGRWIPGVRSLIALPTGVLRMPRGRCIVLTLIGSTVKRGADHRGLRARIAVGAGR
jgi:membrane protein DedA with SNARE-associated domain